MIAFPTNLISGIIEPGLAFGSLIVSVYQAFSRGSLRLTAVDPEVEPTVDCRLLSDERDLIRLRDGVRRLFTLARHPALSFKGQVHAWRSVHDWR